MELLVINEQGPWVQSKRKSRNPEVLLEPVLGRDGYHRYYVELLYVWRHDMRCPGSDQCSVGPIISLRSGEANKMENY